MFPAEVNRKPHLHWSFLYDKSKLLVIGENKLGTHPRNRFNLKEFHVSMKSICSELNLFIRAKSKFNIYEMDWKKLILINVRLNRNEEISNSCPCKACQNLINYIGLKNIYYTTDTGEFEKFEILK